MRNTNDGEDGNGLRYRFLKKRQDFNFSKVRVWLKKCCCSVDCLREIAFNHLVNNSTNYAQLLLHIFIFITVLSKSNYREC